MKITADSREMARALYGGPYMHGLCVALAIAVHRKSGWDMVAVRDAHGALLHAACLAPSGQYVDVRGFQDRQTFLFGGFTGEIGRTDETALLRDDPKITEEEIEKAGRLVPLLLPDVPGSCAWQERLDQFATGLERLCRETGIWIRPEGLHGIAVYEAYGDEGPFVMETGPSGHVTLDRTLLDDVSTRSLKA